MPSIQPETVCLFLNHPNRTYGYSQKDSLTESSHLLMPIYIPRLLWSIVEQW